MSQKKVDEYKKFKANRKEIFEKEKRQRKINKVLGILATVLVVGGFGCWGVYSYQAEKIEAVSFINLLAQDEYGFLVQTDAE